MIQKSPSQPPSLKFQWFLAAGAVLFIVTLLVFPVFPQMRGRWPGALWNLLHLPAFFAITLGTATILPASLSRLRRVFYAAATGLILGTSTEIVQGLTGRSASFKDLLFNGVGIFLAVVWITKGESPGTRGRLRFAVLAGVAIIACLSPAWGRDLVDFLKTHHHFR